MMVSCSGWMGMYAVMFRSSSSSRSEPSLYPVSPAKDTGVNGSRSSKSGTAFDSRSEAWVAPLDRMNPPRSTMTFSWYCNLDALPALVVLQRASVQPLVCREPLISRIRRCCEPYRPNRATCEHNATLWRISLQLPRLRDSPRAENHGVPVATALEVGYQGNVILGPPAVGQLSIATGRSLSGAIHYRKF